MPKSSLLRSTGVVFILIGFAVAGTKVAMIMATQPAAPARLIQTTHGYPDLLKSAQLKNASGKSIASYRIGWAYVHQRGVEFRKGALMAVPSGVKPGETCNIPDQAVAFDQQARSVIFFVAEVTFTDGSHWRAGHAEIEQEVGLKTAR
jgi:hypothetical protein